MYVIQSLEVHHGIADIHNFCIDLLPPWKRLVEIANITQDQVDLVIDDYHRGWLDSCGFNQRMGDVYDLFVEQGFCLDDPVDKSKEDTRPHVYDKYAISVTWGEWGPEHITVPGNACGLDIDQQYYYRHRGRQRLSPHNIGSWAQKQCILLVFCRFAELVIGKAYDEWSNETFLTQR